MILAFDTTALSHFARASRLDTLEKVTEAHRRVVPGPVLSEIRSGVGLYPALNQVMAANWYEIADLSPAPEMAAFIDYQIEFDPTGFRHAGEAAVLAFSRVHNAIAVLDDRVATHAAERDHINVRSTLTLIINGYADGYLTRSEAESLVDDLLPTDIRLPITSGAGLFAWAYTQGHLT